MHQTKILLVDDEELIVSGLELVINREPDLCVIGTASCGRTALEQCEQLQPDLILLDIQMPEMNGIDVIRELRAARSEMKILILTTFDEMEYITDGLSLGANGYLLKRGKFEKIIHHIREVMDDSFLMPTEIAAKLSSYAIEQRNASGQRNAIGQIDAKPTNKLIESILESKFSRTEMLVIEQMLNRFSNQEICDELSISNGTLRNHLTRIYAKLNVNNRQEAMDALFQLVAAAKK